MKKLFIYFFIFSLCFFSCKTTDSVESVENEVIPETQEEIIEEKEIKVEEELIVESNLENKDEEYKTEIEIPEVNESSIIQENSEDEEKNIESEFPKTGLFSQNELGPRPEHEYKNRPVLRPKDKVTQVEEPLVLGDEIVDDEIEIIKPVENLTEPEESETSIVIDNQQNIPLDENENDKLSIINLDQNDTDKIAQENIEVKTEEEKIKQSETIPSLDEQTDVVNQKQSVQNKTPTQINETKSEETQKASEKPIEPTSDIVYSEVEEPITEDDDLLSDQENIIEIEPILIQQPSRSVELLNGQYLQVSYPGNGWIYIGEEDNTTNMKYYGKKISDNQLIFTLRSQKEGESILHFYKLDNLTDKYIDDLLHVNILPSEDKKNDIVIAPEFHYPEIEYVELDLNENTEEQTNIGDLNESIETQDKNSDLTTEDLDNSEEKSDMTFEPEVEIIHEDTDLSDKSADELLEMAKDAYNNKEYENSLLYLNAFLQIANSKIDEALFLKGQVYEAASNIKDIKKAKESYLQLVNNYKQSPLWNNANKRIIYLDRIYFQIR